MKKTKTKNQKSQWGVCKGCYLTPNRKKSWGGSGQHFFMFWFIVSQGWHVVNRCLGLFIPVFRAQHAGWDPDSWLGQGSEIASRKEYLRFFKFLENVCRGSRGSPRDPVGHLSDENEALGPRSPLVPLSGFLCPVLIRKYGKNIKKQNKNPKGVCVRGVHGNSSIGNSLGTT